MEIRLARPDDAAAIAAVLFEAFVEYRTLYTDEGFAATAISSQEVLERLKEGPVWVAFADAEIIGTASAVPKAGSLYVRGMGVAPLARGHKVGELLLKQIELHADEHNCTRLFLSTTPFLSRAIHLYDRFGFSRTNEGPFDLFGTPLFTMEKPVGVVSCDQKAAPH